MSVSEQKVRPFDDMRQLVANMPTGDTAMQKKVLQIFSSYQGSPAPLGNLSKSLAWLAAYQGRMPDIAHPLVAVFVGIHGLAQTYGIEDLQAQAGQRIDQLAHGRTAMRGAALAIGAGFKIYEMGLEYPSADICQAPALSERDCAAAMAFGMEVVAEGADIMVLGCAGVGSVTAAASIVHMLYGGEAAYWAQGQDAYRSQRISVVAAATRRHSALATDPLSVLRCFGGRDIAGLVGAIVAARHQRIPVILDGFVACAAATVLHSLAPDSIAHCMAGHVMDEPAHQALLDRLECPPLLDFKIGVGDGTGSIFALGVLKQACQAFASLA